MSEEVSAIVEEYLEAIYKLQERNGAARTSDLVNMLHVVAGTVTNTVERLEKWGYVTHEPYRGVKLTERGRRLALEVIRKHRLSERLLTDILHMKWDKVHEAACKLEHGITDEILKPLEKALKHPKTCPHGNPIPTKCGGIIEEESQSLSDLKEAEQGIIMKIINEESELLRYLENLGLVPGASVTILEKVPFDGPITIKVKAFAHSISRTVASIIQVKRIK